MNDYEHARKLSQEAIKFKSRIERNLTISVTGVLLGALISIYSVNPMINEAKIRIANSSYETSKEKVEEIYEDAFKLYNFGSGLTKASLLYLVPGMVLPALRHKRRKKSLEKELNSSN